jgi:hypothetical protein
VTFDNMMSVQYEANRRGYRPPYEFCLTRRSFHLLCDEMERAGLVLVEAEGGLLTWGGVGLCWHRGTAEIVSLIDDDAGHRSVFIIRDILFEFPPAQPGCMGAAAPDTG